MADNAQKTPLARSINRFAERKVSDAIQLLGKALPCSVVQVAGSIVTVKFEINSQFTLPQVTVPMFGPEFIRYPIQVGCRGVVLPADTYLGGVTGLGGGVADLSVPANLSALIFFPVANKGWSDTDDPNKTVIYGPDGVVIRTLDSSVKMTLSSSGIETVGDVLINGNIRATGTITQGTAPNQYTLGGHIHPANGSPPTPGH